MPVFGRTGGARALLRPLGALLLAGTVVAGCAKAPPPDDAQTQLMRFDNVRGQRYTEILPVWGNPLTKAFTAGVYNTVGLNNATGTGDSSPQALLDKLDVKRLEKENDALTVIKNGPRLWALDWAEVKAGKIRDFDGLQAHWIMWFDVPPEMVGHESTPYKPMSGKRNTHLGINQGSPAFILDDAEGNAWVMKSASLIVDPAQTYESLKDLGARLKKLPPGWKFRAVTLERDLVLTSDDGNVRITQDELGNTYDRAGGPYSNFKP